jgi:predicted permease
MNDLRYALRQLAKSPSFTVVAVLSLALGIAANVIVLGWVRAVLLETVPGAADPGRLAVLAMRNQWGIGETLSYPNLRDVGNEKGAFVGAAGSVMGSVHVRNGEKTVWAWAEMVTENAFGMLGVQAALGRVDFPVGSDAKPGSAPLVVLGDGFWRRFVDADPDIVGKVIQINRHAYTVLGVADRRFKGMMPGLAFDLWVPQSMFEQIGFGTPVKERGWSNFHTLVRLQPGVTLAQANAAAATVTERIRAAYPYFIGAKDSFTVLPMWECPFGAPMVFLPLLRALATASALVLLLVIANLANLLLARATVRQREMAVRLALGARRGRIVRQLLTESLLLAGIGGGMGFLLAGWGVQALSAFIPTTALPISIHLRVDPQLGLVTAVLAGSAGLLFGLVPALQSARAPLTATLNEGARGSDGPGGRQWLRRILAVAQVALALVLLIASALCVQSFAAARKIPLGMDPRNVWVGAFHLDSHGLDGAAATRFIRDVRTELGDNPAVESVAFSETLPLGFEGGPGGSVEVPGQPARPGEDRQAYLNRVSPGYFATMKIPMLDGREFREEDDSKAPSRIILNRTAAERLFPGRSPLGLRCKIWGRECEVVGVAEAGKYRTLGEPAQMQVWTPQAQWDRTDVIALIRTRGNPQNAAALLTAAVKKIAPDVKTYAMTSLEDYIAPAFLLPRTAAVLLTVLGAVALALALMGIYGLMAFLVNRRTREIGIRMALGAGRRDVLAMIVRHGLALACAGLGVGLVVALGVTRLLSGFLLGVDSGDPLTFAAAAILLAGAAAGACWIPARRASRVDPMIALRAD